MKEKKFFGGISPFMVIAMLGVILVYCGCDDDDGGVSNSVLVGEWQECEPDGTLCNDAADDYEVIHMKLRSDGTGDFWTVMKGKVQDYKYTFKYSASFSGTSGTITTTITTSTDYTEVGRSKSFRVTYVDGILHLGEIYYKKISNLAMCHMDGNLRMRMSSSVP